MSIYDLTVGTKIKRVSDGAVGEITVVHPPKNYHYAWYTVVMPDGKRHYVKTWDFPKYFEIL